MATYQTYTAIGMREDLSDVIYNISPTDTPFMSSIGKTKATAVLHEWQTDSLAAASLSNYAVEGATASDATMSPTTRVGNRTQIAQKTIKISGTLQSVDKAGRKSEKAYQLAKASSEIKRDMETSLLSNQIAANGDSSTARTDGTNRTFTEDILKVVIKEVYASGGNPKVLMVNPAHKQLVSAFAGIAAQRFMAPSNTPTTIVSAADVYLSDFGAISIVPNRFMTSTNSCNETAFILDPDMAAIAYLRPFQTNELAVTGDNESTQLLAEYTLEVKNQGAHGIVADITP